MVMHKGWGKSLAGRRSAKGVGEPRATISGGRSGLERGRGYGGTGDLPRAALCMCDRDIPARPGIRVIRGGERARDAPRLIVGQQLGGAGRVCVGSAVWESA